MGIRNGTASNPRWRRVLGWLGSEFRWLILAACLPITMGGVALAGVVLGDDKPEVAPKNDSEQGSTTTTRAEKRPSTAPIAGRTPAEVGLKQTTDFCPDLTNDYAREEVTGLGSDGKALPKRFLDEYRRSYELSSTDMTGVSLWIDGALIVQWRMNGDTSGLYEWSPLPGGGIERGMTLFLVDGVGKTRYEVAVSIIPEKDHAAVSLYSHKSSLNLDLGPPLVYGNEIQVQVPLEALEDFAYINSWWSSSGITDSGVSNTSLTTAIFEDFCPNFSGSRSPRLGEMHGWPWQGFEPPQGGEASDDGSYSEQEPDYEYEQDYEYAPPPPPPTYREPATSTSSTTSSSSTTSTTADPCDRDEYERRNAEYQVQYENAEKAEALARYEGRDADAEYWRRRKHQIKADWNAYRASSGCE